MFLYVRVHMHAYVCTECDGIVHHMKSIPNTIRPLARMHALVTKDCLTHFIRTLHVLVMCTVHSPLSPDACSDESRNLLIE